MVWKGWGLSFFVLVFGLAFFGVGGEGMRREGRERGEEGAL